MTTRADIIAEARRWTGTRWQHAQAARGVGCDCIGLVRGVAQALGILPDDFEHGASWAPYRGYGREPDGRMLRQGLAQHMTPVTGSHRPADVLLLRWDAWPMHVAIATDVGMIHAWAQRRAVVEHAIDDLWRSRIVCAFAFPGLEG